MSLGDAPTELQQSYDIVISFLVNVVMVSILEDDIMLSR